MSGKRSNKKHTQTEILVQALRRPDLSVLGASIVSLPPTQWQERMFFVNAPDTDLFAITGKFPATFRENPSTHPFFVLKNHPTGNFICPCSTKGNPVKQRYIKKGCGLAGTGKLMDNNSFLVETCSFTLPLDYRFSRKIIYLGTVPASCIVEKGASR